MPSYLTGLPLGDLLKEVADLPDGSLVYYLHVQQDGTGRTFAPAEVAERVAAAANAPVYGHVDTYIGRYDYKLVRVGKGLKIKARRAVLDNEALRPHGKISFIL